MPWYRWTLVASGRGKTLLRKVGGLSILDENFTFSIAFFNLKLLKLEQGLTIYSLVDTVITPTDNYGAVRGDTRQTKKITSQSRY